MRIHPILVGISVVVLAFTVCVSVIGEEDEPLIPVRVWEESFDKVEDIAYDIVVDQTGDVIVVGTSGIIKYTGNGREIWKIETDAVIRAVAVDSMANIITAGDDGIYKYTPNGILLWQVTDRGRFHDVAITESDETLALSEERLSRFSATGRFLSSMYLGKSALCMTTTVDKVIIGKANNITCYQGRTKLWSRGLSQAPRDIAVDTAGNIIVVTETKVVKLSSQGNKLWARSFDGQAHGVATVTGEPFGELLWGAQDDIMVTGFKQTEQGMDYHTVKYSSNGQMIWNAFYDSGNGDDIAFAIAVGENGDALVTGTAPFAQESPTEKSSEAAMTKDYHTIRYSVTTPPVGMIGAVEDEAPPVVELSPPEARFSFSPETPLTTDTIRFTNTSKDSDGWIVSQFWSLGDGSTTRVENPTHRYKKSGPYEVSLTVVDNDGLTDTTSQIIQVGNVPPEVAFSWESEASIGELEADFTWEIAHEQHGSYPLGFNPTESTDLDDILFQDLSTCQASSNLVDFSSDVSDWDGVVVGWQWNFGDGKTSGEPNPSHEYDKAGTYHVVLAATDDNGATSTHAADVKVGETGGEIDTWEWTFGDGGSSFVQNPTHWYQDDNVYNVTLTIYAGEDSDSVTKPISVLNVPPVADFTWGFEQPWDLVPPCGDLFEGGGPEGEGARGMLFGEGEGFGFVCQEPTVPSNAGVVAFEDLSTDSESWFTIVAWEWDFGKEGSCWESEGCETFSDLEYLYLTENEEEYLYRGDVDVTLMVWDNDGEGGGDYDFTTVVHTVTVANIPPYAAFDYFYSEWDSFSEVACSGGDATKTASNGTITVTREIENWETWEAVFAPWNNGGVTLTISGTGPVDVTETVPEGWEIGYWGGDLTLNEDGDTLNGSIDLSEGDVEIYYDLYPPNDDTAIPGTYQIQGDFDDLVSNSDVVLCTTVDVDQSIEFYGYGDEDSFFGSIDPNGDEIASWNWSFGESGQLPGDFGWCDFYFENLTAEYEDGEWWWSYDLPVSLTVTDEAGGSTTASTTLELSGPCGGMAE